MAAYGRVGAETIFGHDGVAAACGYAVCARTLARRELMNVYRSTFDATYKHPNFVLSLSSELDVGAEWLLGFFESEVRRGIKFQAGQTVQVGWMLVKLVADPSGDLEIWEPILDAMPIEWIKGATSTFRHFTLQREACSQLGVEPEFPSLLQSGVVSARFLTDSGEFTMSRDDPMGSDSGWAFTRVHERDLGGRHHSLFEVGVFDRMIIPFLALPSGVLVRASNEHIDLSLGSVVISSESNEFLRRLLDSSESLWGDFDVLPD
jgi:hypothetical protein